MEAIMANNWIHVRPGDPAFNVLSNMCNFFEIGNSQGDDLWLMGEVVEGEFLFNGRLFLRDGKGGTVIDNFPKAVPDGWTRRPSLDQEGYDLVDKDDEVIFGYRVDANRVCHVTVNLYRADGALAAHGGQGALVLHNIQALIGRGGIRVGGGQLR